MVRIPPFFTNQIGGGPCSIHGGCKNLHRSYPFFCSLCFSLRFFSGVSFFLAFLNGSEAFLWLVGIFFYVLVTIGRFLIHLEWDLMGHRRGNLRDVGALMAPLWGKLGCLKSFSTHSPPLLKDISLRLGNLTVPFTEMKRKPCLQPVFVTIGQWPWGRVGMRIQRALLCTAPRLFRCLILVCQNHYPICSMCLASWQTIW